VNRFIIRRKGEMNRSAVSMLRGAASLSTRAFASVRAPVRGYHQVRTTPEPAQNLLCARRIFLRSQLFAWRGGPLGGADAMVVRG